MEKDPGSRGRISVCHSVEFCIKGLDLPYQFRVWENNTEAMNVLVNGDSGILPLIKVGDIFEMKYYLMDSAYPLENIRTAITHVIRKDEGRLKGHYLIGLEILDN